MFTDDCWCIVCCSWYTGIPSQTEECGGRLREQANLPLAMYAQRLRRSWLARGDGVGGVGGGGRKCSHRSPQDFDGLGGEYTGTGKQAPLSIIFRVFFAGFGYILHQTCMCLKEAARRYLCLCVCSSCSLLVRINPRVDEISKLLHPSAFSLSRIQLRLFPPRVMVNQSTGRGGGGGWRAGLSQACLIFVVRYVRPVSLRPFASSKTTVRTLALLAVRTRCYRYY